MASITKPDNMSSYKKNYPNICIPSIYNKNNKNNYNFIKSIFEKLNIGNISHIKILPHKNNNDYKVIIYFKFWYTNHRAIDIRSRLINNQPVNIIYIIISPPSTFFLFFINHITKSIFIILEIVY